MRNKYFLLIGVILIFIVLILILLFSLNNNVPAVKPGPIPTPETSKNTFMELGIIKDSKTSESFSTSVKLSNLENKNGEIIGSLIVGSKNFKTLLFSKNNPVLSISYQNHPYTYSVPNEKISFVQYKDITDAFEALSRYKGQDILIKYYLKNISPSSYSKCNSDLHTFLNRAGENQLKCMPLAWEITVYDKNN